VNIPSASPCQDIERLAGPVQFCAALKGQQKAGSVVHFAAALYKSREIARLRFDVEVDVASSASVIRSRAEYAHDAPDGIAVQDYLGVDRQYYHPVERGEESRMAERYREIRALLRGARQL
jgi:hypothetical protein